MAPIEHEFELKFTNGEEAVWVGETGEDAARRYIDTFPDKIVVSIRPVQWGLVIGAVGITIDSGLK